MSQAARVRIPFELRGAEARAYWREVAKKFGRIDAWTAGGRERVRIVFRVKGKDRYLWSDVNRWGEPVPLTRASATELLAEIRARVVEVKDLESALAPFLRIDAPENWLGSAWERYLRDGPLFMNPRATNRERRWSHRALQQVWYAACDAACKRRFPLYEGTRHSFATALLARGVDRARVQRILGHTSPATTDRYAKLADGALVEALRPKGGT